MKKLVILPSAAKGLRRHRTDAARIIAKLEAYAADPATQANNVKTLSGSTAMRLRIGDYRAVFEETGDAVIVTKIAPRGSVYD